MKTKKTTRILSALLAVVMVFLMIPFSGLSVYASETVSNEATQEGVGRGFDARKSNLSKPSFTQGKIVEVVTPQTQRTPSAESTYLSASTLLEMTNKYSETLNVSVGLDIPISKVNLGVDTKFSKESSTSTTTKKSELYEIYTVSDIRQTISIDGYDGDLESLELSSSFLNKIEALETAINDGDMSKANLLIDQLFDYYGTHLVTSYYLGGRLEATNHITSKQVLTETQLKTYSALSVDIGAGKLFNVSTDIEMTTDGTSIEGDKNTNHHMKINDLGGVYPSMNSLSDPNYKSWRESLDKTSNLAVIGFVNDNSLVGVWELISNDTVSTLVRNRYFSTIQGYYYEVPEIVIDNDNGTTTLSNISYVEITDDERTKYVAPNSTIYLNVTGYTDKLLTYSIIEGSALATINERCGIITINDSSAESGKITVLVQSEEGIDICQMTFIVKCSQFSGGYGTEKRPYLLSTPEDIVKLANDSTYYNDANMHFMMTNSIDMSSYDDFNGIPSFYGAFDGNGFAIYGMSLHFHRDTNPSTFSGFVHKNYGTIKNFTVGNKDGEQSSIWNWDSLSHDYSMGGIAGINEDGAIIENCTVENVKMYQGLYHFNTNQTMYAKIGGIAGANFGIIKNCTSQNNIIETLMETDVNTGDDNQAFAGGIVGCNYNLIEYCISKDNYIRAHAEGNGTTDGDNHAYPLACAGGMSGFVHLSDNYIKYCISYENDVKASFEGTHNDGWTVGDYRYSGGVAWSCGTEIMCYKTKVEEHNPSDTNCNQADVDTIASIFASNSQFAVDSENYMEVNTINDVTIDTSALETFIEGDTFMPNNLMIYGMKKSGTRMNDEFEFFTLVNCPEILERGENMITVMSYGGVKNTIAVNAMCAHKDTAEISSIDATCTSVGYTTGTYCNDCKTYIEGHEEIPVLSEHPFGNWSKYDENQHMRECDCGEVEYAVHDWNTGTVTKEATHLEEGELRKTCSDCGATKVEVIQKLTDHTFGSWTKYSDTQHVRTCACGEKEYVDHDWNAGTVTKEATHLEEGELTKTCSDCGATKVEAIEKIPNHTFGSWTKHSDTQHVRACACGEKGYVDHNWDDGVETIAPTYNETGEMTYTCVDCRTTKTEEIPSLEIGSDMPQIVVDSKTATAGGKIQISVNLTNNPGVVSMYLNLIYDTDVLELLSVEDEGLLKGKTFGQTLTSPYAITWDDSTASANNTANGKIVTFTFKVKDDAELGTTTVSIAYNAGDIIDFDLQNVEFATVDGTITIVDYTPGDVNMDGEVNAVDVAFVRRHLAGWEDYKVISTEAADVNKDGTVNATDVALLRRYLAKWDGIVLQ